MSETPTTEEMFEAFALWNEAIDPEDFRPEFDRFIAKVKAEAYAEAVEDCTDRVKLSLPRNPYRALEHR